MLRRGKWRAIGGILVLVAGMGLVGVAMRRDDARSPQAGTSVRVVATFYPLAEFARQVGGVDVVAVTATPPGVEPHDFEPTPQQVASLYRANLLLMNGGGVDAWASQLAPALSRAGVRVLEMQPLMGPLLTPAARDAAGGAVFDEHFWLDPKLAQKEVEAIRDALMAIDPSHAEGYRSRAASYIRALQDLDHDFARGLADCRIRSVVTSHASLGYLARAHGFQQIAITGISPEETPSAGALAAIARQVRQLGIRYIFFETLVSPALAQTLAREVGAQTLVFNPLEGLTDDELARGANYLSVMRENLTHLRTAMVCP